MANQPFDREVINVRERPLSSDLDFAFSYGDQALREALRRELSVRNSISDPTSTPQSGFFGTGFFVKPNSPAAMSVFVSQGLGFLDDPADAPSAIGGIVGVNDLSPYKPLSLTTDELINVPASDPGNPRIDIVEVKADRRLMDPTTRDILNPGTGVFGGASVNKTLAFNQNGRSSVNGSGSINYKTGTPAGVPVAPATTAGYTKIAEIDVPAASTTIIGSRIRDLRRMIWRDGIGRASMKISVPSNTAGFTVATISELVAPPGVRIAATGIGNWGSPNNNANVQIWVIAGASITRCVASVTQQFNSHFGTPLTFINVLPTGPINLNALNLADIATFSNPAPVVAVGQPAYVFEVNGQAITYPGPVVTSLPNPQVWMVHMAFGY